MGLTAHSMGTHATEKDLAVRTAHRQTVIALAGNPNVGKSTVFNGLTGLHQHTGNWSGKTVTNAVGYCNANDKQYAILDIPGTYSLLAHSAEEEVARNTICFGDVDAVTVVCDATCLERNIQLVLQILETGKRVVVCVNLLDEATRKGITVDLSRLSKRLGVPVVGVVARKKHDLRQLPHVWETASASPALLTYPVAVESAIRRLIPLLEPYTRDRLSARFASLKLLERDISFVNALSDAVGVELHESTAIQHALQEAVEELESVGITEDRFTDLLVSSVADTAKTLCRGVITHEKPHSDHDHRIDRLLTGRRVGYPLMLASLATVFWLTIVGANIPSQWLSTALFWGQDRLSDLCYTLGAPSWLHGAVVLGAYRVLAWVVSVMLPPMAIFFPLFTLLEDVGYLPRIAYNLDHAFSRCGACGKQALTMAMGFGCNAAGVVGARIVDSPRERLLAIVTNTFVPCNGRFPTLITLLSLFFIGAAGSLGTALLLTVFILLGIVATLGMTKLLSHTILSGVPSSFALELPPYRKPQLGRVVVRSLLDRTIFVLGRAAAVAAPVGLLIWVLANITVHDSSLLQHSAAFLDPFAQLLGLDGVILLAFILGFPANEIVIPIMVMTYLAEGQLITLDNMSALRDLLIHHGWTWKTAISMVLFTLFHWPCSTTLLTVYKETHSPKWTAVAFLLPTAVGILACMLFTALST